MKLKRKAVSNEVAGDIPVDLSCSSPSEIVHIDEVSGSSSVNHSAVSHIFRDGPMSGSCPVVSWSVQPADATSSVSCNVVDSSSLARNGHSAGAPAGLIVDQNVCSNNDQPTVLARPSLMNFPDNVPAHVPTISGVATNLGTANIAQPVPMYVAQSALPQGVRYAMDAHHGPMLLDFSLGTVVRPPHLTASTAARRVSSRRSTTRRYTGSASASLFLLPTRTPLLAGATRRTTTGQPYMGVPDGPPVQGPVAPPAREGAPSDYRRFGRCDQLFRTARDKLQEANIPDFSIRLFGVVGANQYELPTGNDVGAIVYEGGPETTTDYDVVIRRTALWTGRRRRMALTTDEGTSSKSADMPIVPSRQLAYLTELNPADNTKFIEVRVYRRWTSVKVPGFALTGFSCMLLDKKGTEIQANADLKDKERFERDLQINSVYKIQGFGFDKADSWGKTLDNDIVLCLGKYTQIDPLQDTGFPYHYFNFAAFNELNARLEKKNLILTDYIGYVHNVDKTKEYGAATTTRVKVRNIGIRNLNNNVVLFTLWNDDADNFNEDEYGQMKQPVILAVSSCYLKRYAGQIQLSATSATRYYFNPDVQETRELLAAYNGANTAGLQLEVQTERLTNWEEERNRNRVPLATLLQTDPKTQQRVLFTQDAMILQVDTTHDWYYQKCDECGGKLRYGYLHGQCHQYGTEAKPQNSYCFRIVITDGTGNALMSYFTPQTDGLIKDVNTLLQEVDNKDPQTIPAPILALQNTRHIFQFQFATPISKGPPTFVLKKIMDTPQISLPEPAVAASTSPTTIPEVLVGDQSTPPPATPTPTQDTPIETPSAPQPPTRTAARKELFAETIEKENYPAPKKQKKD
ncbi:nucleic acid-binding, OB-fold protein [Artemisia annua]|uniref:Nucleic acid-binding, OB-fold protein n=1 Tax=Artemisia annua TaxID=35608 RepID=A0A2U1P964_ARTAN|nr:nucleic acid-binding, OB-fold protein [Artemisia annua]